MINQEPVNSSFSKVVNLTLRSACGIAAAGEAGCSSGDCRSGEFGPGYVDAGKGSRRDRSKAAERCLPADREAPVGSS